MDCDETLKKQRTLIRLTRTSGYWKKLRKFCLLYIACLLILAVYQYLPLPQSGLCYTTIVFIQQRYFYYFLLFVAGFCALSLLLRPRFLCIDPGKGLIYYNLPICGSYCYYFVEVCGLAMEVDMSQVLLKLNCPKLHRLYLKLHSGKRLLVAEDTSEQKVLKLSRKLQRIFNINSIEHLSRIGRKTSKNINLGDYSLEKELSHGGMGKVFLATDKRSNEKVAVKVLPSSLALRENYVTSFAREIRILQKLMHPGIVKIHDVGRDTGASGDVYFYAMEFIEGQPLSQIANTTQISYDQCARFIMESALALDYIHKHGVIHRDIKPSNIMIRSNGSVVLIDFGIARDLSWTKSRQRPGGGEQDISHYIGTLPYMSPEQVSSRYVIDYRTDIYSLGVTMYEILAGKRPFKGGDQTMCRSILNWYPPELQEINPEIPRELDIITMRAMEKDKHRRYSSGAEFAEDLHRWLNGKPILSARASRIARIWRKFRGWFRWIG